MTPSEEKRWERIFWGSLILLGVLAVLSVLASGCTVVRATCPGGPTVYHVNLLRVSNVGVIHPESDCIIALSDEAMSETLGATALGGAALGALIGGPPGAAAGASVGGVLELGKAILESREADTVLDDPDDPVPPDAGAADGEDESLPGGGGP